MGPPIAKECQEFFEEILESADIQTHVSNLPTFLRKFTSGSVMAYVLTKYVVRVSISVLFRSVIFLISFS